MQILVEDKGIARIVTLNRPRVLNCINLEMVTTSKMNLMCSALLSSPLCLVVVSKKEHPQVLNRKSSDVLQSPGS